MIGRCDVLGCEEQATNHIAREGGFDLCREHYEEWQEWIRVNV